MKIFVAIPVYDGKLPVEAVRCLLNEQVAAQLVGDEFQVRFLPSCSHAAMGRNQLVDDFMSSDAERLVFLDSDVTFEAGALIKLAHKPVDFVGGAYRYKQEQESYPVGWLPDPNLNGLQWNEHELLEVMTLPGGFLALSRNVFESLKAAHPGREYEHFGRKAHCYFQMLFTDGYLYGEDSFFCREWRETGGKVFLDPMLSLTHWDFNRPFVGNIGSWLRSRSQTGEK